MAATYFLFATGIENSCPTVGRRRVDQLQSCGHYERWREDFDLVGELGVACLRYGPPILRTWLGPDRYDWDFADRTFAELRRRRILPIVDLCHFGVPDWIGDFQNADFPALFARYARAFAERFPWVQLYTPVNEREDAQRSEVRHLVSRFFKNSQEQLALNILEEKGLDREEINRLKQMLERSSKETGRA